MSINEKTLAPQSSGALHELPWLPRPVADFNAKCRQAVGEPHDFGKRIRALASTALDENQLARLARVIESGRGKGHSLEPLTPFKLAVITLAPNVPDSRLMFCVLATEGSSQTVKLKMWPGTEVAALVMKVTAVAAPRIRS